MFILDSDFNPSRILCFVATYFTKFKSLFFEMLKKKIWPNFHRIIELFIQKIVTKLSKIWVWDTRSWIWKTPIPDPGSRGLKVTASATLVSKQICVVSFWCRMEYDTSQLSILLYAVPNCRRVQSFGRYHHNYTVRYFAHKQNFFSVFLPGFFLDFYSVFYIQRCFIYRPSNSTVSENAGIEPRSVAISALAVRGSNQPLS